MFDVDVIAVNIIKVPPSQSARHDQGAAGWKKAASSGTSKPWPGSGNDMALAAATRIVATGQIHRSAFGPGV